MKSFLLTGLLTLISTSSFAQGVYDANFAALNFSSSGTNKQNLISGSTSSGTQYVYTNVITINGQQIDCKITYTNNQSRTLASAANFDRNQRNVTTGFTANDNITLDNMFIPTLNRQDRSTFTFEFGVASLGQISGGLRTLTSFTPVVLKNIILNIYDIDRHRNNNGSTDQFIIVTSNYTSASRFTNTNNATRIGTLNINDQDVEFRGDNFDNSETSLTSITDSRYRGEVIFGAVSTIDIETQFRTSSSASTSTTVYFDFSSGVSTSINKASTNNPTYGILSLDLDRSSTSQNNNENKYFVQSGNSTTFFSDGSNNTNLFVDNSTLFNDVFITVPIDQIRNTTSSNGGGTNRENILIRNNNSTLATIPLDQNTSNNTFITFTLNNITYSIEVSTVNNNTLREVRIFRNNTRMSKSEVEQIIDMTAYNHSGTGNNYTTGVRLFSMYVDAEINNNGTISPSVFFIADMGGILPVDLISFTGLAKTEGNQLNWTVAQEVDFSHYEVLRSTNGKDFTKVGEVYPENKSTEMKNYTFLDASVKADLAYYKLNLINEDGTSSYSNLVVINRTVVAPVITKLYPNPATTTLLVSLEGVDAELSTITIQDLSGKIVYSTETSDVATLLNINELNKGMYIVKVASQSGFVSVSRFIKN